MFIETERRIWGKDGQELQCKLQVRTGDTWLREFNELQKSKALQEVEELFLYVFGKLAKAEPGTHDLDTFYAEIKQAIWGWEHK